MNTKRPSRPRCPICGRPPVVGLLPFCSKRCADADLSRWLTGAYAVPGDEIAASSGDAADGE
jgi:endogenous inhibitor of DNA gyrase (YacG/DUF329 family)